MDVSWPSWATSTCGCLGLTLAALHGRNPQIQISIDDKNTPEGFSAFQREYLMVYLSVMFADWLQGPNMYTLYQGYGMDVGTLFMIGFTSSALTSGIVGKMVDKYGRKRACLIFCLLEIVINGLEHVPNFYVLAFGRILGGISTSILFSAFESWMVAEHRRRKYPDELLGNTFTIATEANGIIAIIAGLVAQVAADLYGDIAPFQLAIVATIVAASLIAQWPEDSTSQQIANDESRAIKWTWNILAVGFTYSLFEGAMFIFVFMWVPTLQHGTDNLPVGLVFSSFMLCLAIGGKLSSYLPRDPAHALTVLSLTSSLCMLFPSIDAPFLVIFGSFLLFEISVGAFFPISSTLRASAFPPHTMGTLLSLFRLPTNLLVLLGTQMNSWNSPSAQIFSLCLLVFLSTAFLATKIQSPKVHYR